MTSTYSTAAEVYRDQGLSVIPCVPGDKFPGKYASGQWWAANDWDKYCDRLPTSFETQLWDRWPDAGVCLALGSSSAPRGKILVAVDIDTDDSVEAAAIKGALPGSPVAKRGRKGETQFYLANPCVVNRSYNDGNRRRMLDLLCHGRQTVMPPTMHPEGMRYHWITPDTLDSFDVADLPMLPDDIGDRLAEALKPFGYEPNLPLGGQGNADLDGDSIHRALNDAALQNLDAWVPALGLYNCIRTGNHYRAVAHWRPSSSGQPDAKRKRNMSIAPEGIKDFGDGDKGYTPLDLVMKACGADLERAFAWLQERVAPPKAVAVLTPQPTPIAEPQPAQEAPKGNLAGLRLATFNGEAVADATLGREEERVQLPAVVPQAGVPVPVDSIIAAPLCTPPGLIGEITGWIIDSSDEPYPQLALGATLSFLGAIMGRRWESPTGLRTNVYSMGIAPTGFGKNHARRAIGSIARTASLAERFIGPSKFLSDSAVRSVLQDRPTFVCLMDEIGAVFRDILSPKAGEHKAAIKEMLLELFTSANDTYYGAARAAEKAVPIHFPNLCIYGTSTPDVFDFFSGLHVTDGFLPRWLVFDVGDKRADIQKHVLDVADPPTAIRAKLHALLNVRPEESGNLTDIAQPRKAIRAAWGEGAEAAFYELRAEMRTRTDAARRNRRRVEETMCSRFAEHVGKLSLIYAVGINPQAPMITLESLAWARQVVEASTAAMVDQIEGRLANSPQGKQYKDVLRLIRAAGEYGIPEKALLKQIGGDFDMRRFNDILAQQEAAGEIWRAVKSGPRGGRTSQRAGAWGVTDDEDEAAA